MSRHQLERFYEALRSAIGVHKIPIVDASMNDETIKAACRGMMARLCETPGGKEAIEAANQAAKFGREDHAADADS